MSSLRTCRVSLSGLILVAPRLALAEPAGASEPAPAAAPPSLTEAELGPVYSVAITLAARPPCAAAGDLAAADDFSRAAALLDVAARHYPPAGPRVDSAAQARKRLRLVEQAVDLHVTAYQCAPGYAQRHHLERALALIDAARELVTAADRLPADAPELDALAARRAQLAAALPEPPPPPRPARRRREPAPAPEPPPYFGRVALRPELGVGRGTLQDDAGAVASFTGVYFQLVAGARVPVGARERHALLLGGVVGVQQVAPRPGFDAGDDGRSLPYGGLRLEFAVYAHPRWLSFHPALELGAAVYVGDRKFGRHYLGPALGLCLDREVVCFNFKYVVSLARPDDGAKIYFPQFGFAVDLLRIVDRRRSRN